MKRFGLKSLLGLATAIALILGYSQWRNRTISANCLALASDGVQFVLPDSWLDTVWQRPPIRIVVMVKVIPDAREDARLIRVRSRLNQMGITDVHYIGPMMEVPRTTQSQIKAASSH